MAEPVDWLDDGTPYSPRFADRYHSEHGAALAQAEGVFLAGTGLPAAWADQPSWSVLETGFGLGLNFLVTWAAWRADPARPQRLHFVSVEAFPARADDLLRAAAAHPSLLPLARELEAQYWGLLPGQHTLDFDGGRVRLTLCIGDARTVLRELVCEADTVFLDGFSPAKNPDIWDAYTLKAVAQRCRRGTRLATWTVARPVRDALAQAGFTVHKRPGIPPKRDRIEAVYDPAWEPRRRASAWAQSEAGTAPSRAVVIGGGLAGAAVAAQLAAHGWAVQVLDAADAPASGASGLPVGLWTPHLSVDDGVLSQLSRYGVRATLRQARRLLHEGTDWAASGVLERRLPDAHGDTRPLPATWPAAGSRWSAPASAEQLEAAGLPAGDAACWHATAGWIRPARLVAQWLQHPAITWRGGLAVRALQAIDGGWRVVGGDGCTLADAAVVVVAAGFASQALLGAQLGLHPIRGQVSWGRQDGTLPTPPSPVNGHGHFIPHAADEAGPIWLTGASFDRGQAEPDIRPADRGFNLDRVQTLLPATGAALATRSADTVADWAGIRCASPDRLPVVGPVDGANRPGLWVCTAMGSRGLSFAPLCAELLVARLHGEPLPLPARLAAALDPARAALQR